MGAVFPIHLEGSVLFALRNIPCGKMLERMKSQMALGQGGKGGTV